MRATAATITPKKVIIVSGLTKAFNGLKVLDNLDLVLHKGENLVVLGRSGSGKSVLIKTIAGLLVQDKGSVIVMEKDMKLLNNKELMQLRLKIGFSFQSSALYDSMTIRQNLEFALIRNKRALTRKEIDDAVTKVLEDVQLLESINKMPSELSGGQTKRIGVARALILKPDIMLYDEPTAGLDPLTAMEINKLILKVQTDYNTSSVIITHDLTCAKVTGNSIAVLNQGRIVKQGTFSEVFSSEDPMIKGFYNYNFINNK